MDNNHGALVEGAVEDNMFLDVRVKDIILRAKG